MSVAIDALPPQSSMTREAWCRRVASGLLPSVLWVFFVSAHVRFFLQTGSLTGFVVAVQELLALYWFIIRRPVREVSARPMDWLAAGVGTFAVLALRPGGSPLLGAGAVWSAVQVVGVVLSCTASLCLGRSFGLVAANRGVKTSGAYSIVRHPLYATYCITWVGYLAYSPTLRNALVFGVAVVGQLLRVASEERVLRGDPAYARYAERVRWRLLPGVL